MTSESTTSVKDGCRRIASIISDYRKGQIREPDPKHVQRWLDQFPDGKRSTIASEMANLLESSYYSKAVVKEFFELLVDTEELLDGVKPEKFWKRVNFVRVQQVSRSQSELLNILGGILHRRFGYWSRDCGSRNGPWLYLDDFIFTGNTIRRELLGWLAEETPANPHVHIVVLAYHTYGQYYADRSIRPAINNLDGSVSFWSAAVIEDRKARSESCDVLRPRKIYANEPIQKYVNGLKYAPALRDDKTSSEYYASEKGRRALEYEFLRVGIRIRRSCENPELAMRPLGFSSLDSFGTGAIVATYRNCPNTCPLAWWWGDPTAPNGHPLASWYPLFPRKYNIR